MLTDLFELGSRLKREREPFVLATVVARDRPQSVSLGARAIVRSDGTVRGWVGGGCVRPTVVDEALQALRDGQARLVRIGVSPDDHPPPGVRVYPMTCHGGGRVEVYVEPVLPMPRLVVFGVTPVARSLAEMAVPLGFEVAAVDPRAGEDVFPSAERIERSLAGVHPLLGQDTFIVVATQGEGDEDALRAALVKETAYVGLVASRKKGRTILALLEGEGVPAGSLDRVRYPAGLDLGGMSPPEIAVSILAELIALRSGKDPAALELPSAQDRGVAARGRPLHPAPPAPASESRAPGFATDPVCGMAVQIEGARYRTDHGGETLYFCCPMCQGAFEKDPDAYTGAAHDPGGPGP